MNICVASIVPVVCMAIGLFSSNAGAESASGNSGYLTDQRGQVVKSGFGLCWRTGSWTPAMATEECDPSLVPKKTASPAAVVAPAVVRAPAPRAQLPKPAAEKVTLPADSLFDFDKAVIRADGKAQLDALLGKIKGVDVEAVIAVGYTDRIGSKAYNLKLSLRRADAVKAYLMSHGIPANRIQVEGKGKLNPVTRPGQCKGPKSPKVIKCLQPDRRVEIEVIGTRSH